MPLLIFVIGDSIGTLLWTGLLVELGWSIGHRGVRIVDAVQHYQLLCVVVLVAAGLAVSMARRRRSSAAATT